MRVLVTASRMPFALDLIRKLGRGGHSVYAADPFTTAPGGHSRFVRERLDVAPPEYSPLTFLAQLKQIVHTRHIELLLPCFEEIFYIARHHDELSEVVPVMASPFSLLKNLHDKSQFQLLADELGIATPDTTRVESQSELRQALRWYRRYVARPIFSRGGMLVLANDGPLAGMVDLEACRPSPDQPWIVQEYIGGRDLCTFSVAHHGRLLLHCTYVHPLELEHRGGIVFESVDDGETIEQVRRLVEATGFHGQLGLDFRRDARRAYAIECNPRPTAGIHLTSTEELMGALFGHERLRLVPSGRRRKYTSAVLRDLLLHWTHLRSDAGYLLASDMRDVYREAGDPLPGLFQVLSYAEVLAYRAHHRAPARGTSLMAAYFDGLTWNGQAIP